MLETKPLPVIVDTSRSAHARLRPVSIEAVALSDDFWAPRLRVNRDVTLPAQYRLLEETGRIDNFRRAAGARAIPFRGYFFNDSDVFKWLEAAAWTLAVDTAPPLEKTVAALVAIIAAAQQADGYLNTYFTFERAAERWTNLRDMHELYCAGHLIQAAVAHYRATWDDGLLRVAVRLADHICGVFGEREGACGHPEIEMALVELARATGQPGYLRQAQSFLDARGRGLLGGDAYRQDHRPFRALERMEGHAVRAVYLNAGAADVYAETGETALREALERMWDSMTTRQMYLSGGLGARYEGEAFGEDYELPNARAYAETCAAIGSVMWNWRMLLLTGQARYADVMELALYNSVLSGVSLDGQAYFYRNPLASDGTHRRQQWFECACCPPNVARLIASLPGYLYSLSDEGVWAHLYADNTAALIIPGGHLLRFVQRTRYPWDGAITFQVDADAEFSLYLRIPGWCEGAALEINGRLFDEALAPGSYAQIRRQWRPGDVAQLNLPMPVRRVESHPYVAENAGRAALMRGPLLYCVEQADNPGLDVRDIVLPGRAELSTVFCPDVLGGVVIVRGPAEAIPPDQGWADCLYRTARPGAQALHGRPVEIAAIPYYAWANREPGPMQVLLRTR